MGDWVAVYAGIIATLALAWEVVRWWRDREPKLEVVLSVTEVFRPPIDGGPRADSAELLVIEVLNRSSTQRANVTSVGYGVEEADGALIFRAVSRHFEGATLPGVIEPNDAGITTRVIRRGDEMRFSPVTEDDPDAQVFGWAWTSTGRKPVESQRYAIKTLPRRARLRDVPKPPWLWPDGTETGDGHDRPPPRRDAAEPR